MINLSGFSVGLLSLVASLAMSTSVMAASHHHDRDCHHHDHDRPIIESYGSFYTVSTAAIAPDAIIPLSVTQNSTDDVSLNGSGVITLNIAGTYYVDFGASQITAGNPLQVQLAINGVGVSGAELASNPAPAGILSFSTIITVEAGDQLTLLNSNSTTDLDLGTGIAGTPTAFLTLSRLTPVERIFPL